MLTASWSYTSMDFASGSTSDDPTDPFGLDGMTLVVQALQDEAPVRSGTLRDSIVGVSDGAGAWSVQADPVSVFVINGTQPHLILPVVAGALWWEGASHPVKGVQHPGTQPNDFVSRAMEKVTPDLLAIATQRAGNALSAAIDAAIGLEGGTA